MPQWLVLRARIAVTYSPPSTRRSQRFLDRIDGILSYELGLLVKRKAKELRERPVYPVILSRRALLPSHTSSYS